MFIKPASYGGGSNCPHKVPEVFPFTLAEGGQLFIKLVSFPRGGIRALRCGVEVSSQQLAFGHLGRFSCRGSQFDGSFFSGREGQKNPCPLFRAEIQVSNSDGLSAIGLRTQTNQFQ